MTNSIKVNVSRRYKKRIYQKTQLLNKIFPQYEAICLVVLNNLMRDQHNWPKNCMFWYVNQLKLDDKMLVKMTTHKWLKYKKFDKNITQNDFPKFDYYASVRSATKLLRSKHYTKEEFLENVLNKWPHKLYEVHLSENNSIEDEHLPLDKDSWQLNFLKEVKNRIVDSPLDFFA